MVMSSKVARPSGPANDQVISSTPAALRTDFTRSAEGHGVEGSAAWASQARPNLSLTTRRNAVRC